MIRIFLWCLLALGLASALALIMASDPGYILIHYRGYSVEATLSTVIITLVLLAVLFVALRWLLRIINPLQLFRKSTWKNFVSVSPAKATAIGFNHLLLGRWLEAYKLLVENAEKVEDPQLSYLGAAIAAFQRGDTASWNWCLDRAEKKALAETQGLQNLRAMFAMRSGQQEQALVLLTALHKAVPNSPLALQQLKNIYVAKSDWDNLDDLLAELEKQKVVGGTELVLLQEQVYQYKLQQAAENSLDNLRLVWQDLPKSLRSNEVLTGAYLQNLLRFNQDTEAGALLTRFLKQQWSDKLVAMLGFVNSKQPKQQLQMMEVWLKDKPGNPVLLLTLGRLSLRDQLWGKAREYFEQALRATSNNELSAEISAELGRLLEHLGEHEKSLACYQKAMGLLEYKLPQLPLPNVK
ncbi:MAG: heme biosynthesis HemY N-terminal domain-containing protein [Pseudomonadota bacterium]